MGPQIPAQTKPTPGAGVWEMQETTPPHPTVGWLSATSPASLQPLHQLQ